MAAAGYSAATHFAYEYLHEKLGLDYILQAQRDTQSLDSVLQPCWYLVPDRDKCDIFTFGGLAIRCAHRGTLQAQCVSGPGPLRLMRSTGETHRPDWNR